MRCRSRQSWKRALDKTTANNAAPLTQDGSEIDEADRLKTQGLEQLRDYFDDVPPVLALY